MYRYLNNNNLGRVNSRDFKGLDHVAELDLSNSSISSLGGTPFKDITGLKTLLLTNNILTDEGLGTALKSHSTLKVLVLSGNHIVTFPDMPVGRFPQLEEVYITHNEIARLSRENLANMTQLRKLHLTDNPLEGFPEDDDTFADTPKLTLLHFDHTLLTRLPNVTYLPVLTNLHVSHSRLTHLPSDLCVKTTGLVVLEARGNYLTDVPTLSCTHMAHLDISHNNLSSLHRDLLQDMPLMNALELSENTIGELDQEFFKGAENMEFLDMGGNELRVLPDLTDMLYLVRFNVSHNRITRLEDGVFSAQRLMDILYLNSNDIDYVSPTAFPYQNDLKILNMSANPRLQQWKLPGNGFPFLARLYLEDMPGLHQVPQTLEIPLVKDLYLTYAYHCCIWEEYTGILVPNTTQIPVDGEGDSTIVTMVIEPYEPEFPGQNVAVDCKEAEEGLKQIRRFHPDLIFTLVQFPTVCAIYVTINTSVGTDIETLEQEMAEFGGFVTSRSGFEFIFTYREKVRCTPHQNPLTPCRSLLSEWALRVPVWAIWIFAIMGNGAIIFVNMVTRKLKKLECSELLIINLSLAGFLKAIYLSFLAVVDVRTLGNSFFQSAIDWQLGPGCKTAGFIAVFASVLSMYTLVVLTLERVYTISHVFEQSEKKKRRVVIPLCVVGWVVSALLAALPLFGVNSYTRVAVCLPYLTESLLDEAYIGVLLTINLVGFVIILCSYVYIFSVVCRTAPPGQRRKDVATASINIAMVIATAFLCWSPIAVVGYLALFEIYLVDVVQAKYLIVFVYPLNACLDPLIYGFFTKRCKSKMSSLFRRSKDRVISYPPNHHMRLQRTPTAFTAEYQMNKLHSPSSGNGRHEELTRLRQSRRSSSLVVPMVNTNVGNPSPTFCIPTGCNLGRRASLPPGFGSTLNMAGGGDPNLPHYSIPFRGLGSFYSSNNSSLPNLQEESDVDLEHNAVFSMSSCAISCPTATTDENQSNPLTSSQESNLRRLSVVREEENEENLVGNNSPAAATDGEEENGGNLVGNRPTSADTNSGDENDVLSVSSSDSEDYSDASDSLSGSCVVGETDLDRAGTREPSVASLSNTEVGGARGTDLDHMMSMNGGMVGTGGVCTVLVDREDGVSSIEEEMKSPIVERKSSLNSAPIVPAHIQPAAFRPCSHEVPRPDFNPSIPSSISVNHTLQSSLYNGECGDGSHTHDMSVSTCGRVQPFDSRGQSPSLEPNMEKSQLHHTSPATSAFSSPHHSPTTAVTNSNSLTTHNDFSVNPLCTLASQALNSNSETDL